MYVESVMKTQHGSIQRRCRIVTRATSNTLRTALKGSTSSQLPTFSSALWFSSFHPTALWLSSAVVPHVRHTQSSSLSTPSGASMYFMYCKRHSLVHCYVFGSSGKTAAALLPPVGPIRHLHHRGSTLMDFVFFGSVQSCRKQIRAEPDSATPVYHE